MTRRTRPRCEQQATDQIAEGVWGLSASYQAVVDAIGQIDVPMARRAKQGGVAFSAAAKAMAGGLLLGISLGFHHHAPQQAAVWLAFHQAAADEFRTHNFCRATEEGMRQC